MPESTKEQKPETRHPHWGTARMSATQGSLRTARGFPVSLTSLGPLITRRCPRLMMKARWPWCPVPPGGRLRRGITNCWLAWWHLRVCVCVFFRFKYSVLIFSVIIYDFLFTISLHFIKSRTPWPCKKAHLVDSPFLYGSSSSKLIMLRNFQIEIVI